MSKYIGTPVVNVSVDTVDVTGDITTTDTTPEVIIVNSTHEDTDGGREGKVTFKGQQSGGEETTLAQIQASHDGTSDDEKGDLIFKVNDGSDGASPTERLRIGSDGATTITTEGNEDSLVLKSNDADANAGPKLQFNRNSASAADADLIGEMRYSGRNDASQAVDYARIRSQIGDASDGTEDGQLQIATIVAGTMRRRVDFDPTETVFNDAGQDLDFRVEGDTNTTALFVQGSDNRVGVGVGDPDAALDVSKGTNALGVIRMTQRLTGAAAYGLDMGLDPSTGDPVFSRIVNDTVTEVMRIVRSSGDLLVGKTAANNTAAGHVLYAGGLQAVVKDGGTVQILNRLSSDGQITAFRKDGTTLGSISAVAGDIAIFSNATNHSGFRFGSKQILPTNNSGTIIDNDVDLGDVSFRFDDIYATNGTIQTSDENEKQNIASLTSAEITAATAISKLFKTFKWKDKVEAKGDNARTHTGVVAQQVQSAMSDAGLDASKYAFWCSKTWWEKDVEVAAVEADEEKGIEAQDAYTSTDVYDTKDEAPEGATEHTRMGVRYPELLAFIGAATEQRLSNIESRLTALEG